MDEAKTTDEKPAPGTCWQTDIRSPSPTSSSDGQDEEEELDGNTARGKRDRLWFELDLSSREDHAKVQINPFTIAAKNKRVKQHHGPPPKTGLVSNATGDGSTAGPRITLAAQGTERQATAKPPFILPKEISTLSVKPVKTSGQNPPEAVSVAAKPVERHVVTSQATKKPSLPLKPQPSLPVKQHPYVPLKQHQQHITNGKTSKAKDKVSPISFGRLPKIPQGSTRQFPIIQGLQKQEQLAKQQRQHAPAQSATPVRPQQTINPSHGYTQPRPRGMHDARFAHASEQGPIEKDGVDEMAGNENARDLGHYSSGPTAPMETTRWVKAEVDEPYHTSGYPARVPQQPMQPFSYHSNAIKEELYYSPTSQHPQEYASPSFEANNSPVNHAYYHQEISPRTAHNRVSLQAPIHHGRVSLPTARRVDPYPTARQHSASSSINRSGHVPSLAMNTRITRELNASKYFSGQRSTGPTHAIRFGNGMEERSRNSYANKEEDWSTLPVKRTSYNKNASAGIVTQPFRLPGRLFGASQAVQSGQAAQTPGLADRSSDSATEVVVPLRRTKLTLFEPSPPKPQH